ncbi:MAG: LacI family DNA-binding transcriptional regulator [Terrimicrobiaceae bacterium]|nr:LacI family DNA-binding transcriptional regulator [Terrimicrobiaceae bacterium]
MTPNQREPSLRDIAARTGLSVSGVSRALRSDRSIPEATREKVAQAAAVLGYRPRPAVAALMAEIQRQTPPTYRATVAWLRAGDDHSEESYCSRIRRGAMRRAEALGYAIEVFSLVDLSRRRLNHVLKARGIEGLLLAPLPRRRHHLNMDWNDFAAVAIGNSLWRPPLPRVVNHQYHSVQKALREMRRSGYRRIALCLNRENSARTDHNWLAGALVHRHLLGLDIDVMLLGDWERSSDAIVRRLRQTGAEAVLSPHEAFLDFLRRMDLRIPEEMGFVCLDLIDSTDCAGVDQNHELVGAAAVDVLVGQLLRRQTAATTVPMAALVEGCWRTGRTLPPRVHAEHDPLRGRSQRTGSKRSAKSTD